MLRRTFLTLAGIFSLGLMAIFYFDSSLIRRLYYRVEDLFKKPVQVPPDSERLMAELPGGGETVSVEMALNSRCTSDYDGNPKRFHWGMFDPATKLSDQQITRIVDYAKIPRFTHGEVEIISDHNILTFVLGSHNSGVQKEWMMVESGMQQQAIGLVCAALGVGMVFRNLGKDGTPMSETRHANIKIKLEPMRPTYDGSYWSASSPAGSIGRPKGNIPEPERNGTTPLISALGELKPENTSGRAATERDLSQLLWAARGRTPHFFKSRPWAMTIPTWAGEQNISTVYSTSDNTLSRYVNWENKRPTHSLEPIRTIEKQELAEILKTYSPFSRFIVLARNEDFARAFWEVGYQFLNLLLQAESTNINYRANLIDEEQKLIFNRIGIENPAAVFAT